MSSQRMGPRDEVENMPCDVCGVMKRAGPTIFELFRNQTYDIFVCATCRDANRDGWAPHLEGKVLARRRAANQPSPPRLPNALLPPGETLAYHRE
jgi:hypothetical protein